jgi:hypothetical protein
VSERRVYAMGCDPYWLRAVEDSAAGYAVAVATCPGSLAKCLDLLPEAGPTDLLLVDATGQSDIAGVANRLWDAGWRHIVVVAADPSYKEAHTVLRKTRAQDYWQKTYETQAIRTSILGFWAEYGSPGARMGAGEGEGE